MTKRDVDEYAAARPFRPFEVRLVDGHRHRFTKVEQFIVGRNTLAGLDRKGHIFHLSLGLISEIGPARGGNRRNAGSA